MSKEEIALKLTEIWLNKQEKDHTEHTVLKQYNYFLKSL